MDPEDQGLDLKTARERAKAVTAAGDGRDPDVRDVLDSILDEGHDAHANKTLTLVKILFDRAYDHDKISDVPTDRIKPHGAPPGNTP